MAEMGVKGACRSIVGKDVQRDARQPDSPMERTSSSSTWKARLA